MGLGLGADHDLDLAIHRNESSQAADTVLAVVRQDTSSEDGDGSNSSSSSSRSAPSQSDALPSQGGQDHPSIPNLPAEDGISQLDDHDDPQLDDVNDLDQLGEEEEYAEYEQQLQDGEAASDLDSEDIDALHLFSDESEDEEGVLSSDDDKDGNSEVGRDYHEEELDDDAAVDARVHSRHAQDLFDQLASGYRLPSRPVRPPDP
ncbi:hypothetical protein CF328_g7632 [Tilletia controversa]|nr:hypothetical protein CF328_g7632 [Tilletia controversa]